ncbi:MAG: hypothetical protein GXP53_03520 [Deltaproteobacteria bacterium]|nr:hypothetical protein [Deltaproteobacteria bacterium]
MDLRDRAENSGLETDFAKKYMDLLIAKMPKGPRTYGFEYEFLPSRQLLRDDLERVRSLLVNGLGGIASEEGVCFNENPRIDFEPGGQIEYSSPPLLPHDNIRFAAIMQFIETTNAFIFKETGINYMGCAYVPGRADAPLCLTSHRYLMLHERLAKSGTRGHEMMKATAAIHLHAAILGIDDILPVFTVLCRMAREPGFSMSAARREIWDNTDPTRCGIPPCCDAALESPDMLIRRLVRLALNAVVLGEEVAFKECRRPVFEFFLNHLTTAFTDVRFNLKGPTLELRTPDSMPIEDFPSMWKNFIGHFE